MHIDVWADIICPWCGLGAHRLQRALAVFDEGGGVEVAHRSFLLDPGYPEDRVEPVHEMLARKYGGGPDQAARMTGRVEELAQAEGLVPYRVGDNRVGNTFRAHELLAFATEQGLHETGWNAMFDAYFGQARNIFAVETLVEIAGEIGLDGGEAREVLVSRRYREAVISDIEESRRLGISGVPTFIIDGRYAISGAQPADVLVEILEQVRDTTAVG